MGIAIPQVITPSKASGAQIIDGSLKFDETKSQHLKRTPSSAGNRKTHTLSCWVKRTKNTDGSAYFMILAAGSAQTNRSYVSFTDADKLQSANIVSGSVRDTIQTDSVLRDTGTGWYHLVVAIDSTQSTAEDRVKIYINGELQSDSGTDISQNAESFINSTNAHYIGETTQGAEYFDGFMSQVYFIDGQQLGPESFGFTDPLTNTWKPKKYKVALAETVTVQPTYVSNSSVLDPTNAFDGSSGTEATYSGVNSWLSFTVSDASNLTVPFRIRNDSSGTGQTVAMFTDSGGSSAASGTWGSTGTNNLSPAVSTTVDDTYTFPSTGTYYLRHTVGSDSNIFVYKIGGDVTTGANSFYLPLDGNSPIGEDKSGNGNDFTPINFGGSVELDNPQVSGARPILNTTQGGTQAGVGVFGSKQNVGYAVTVYNDGGGNKYYIDGVKQDTVTGLIRGATYTFDTSDSTVSSHPFRFSATSNGSHGGGSEYTNGVAAITGAATTITVPHDAPNTLYYYCTSHSGMGADITGITTNEKLADQYASNCTLAIPFVGSKNNVSASIACTSTTGDVTNVNAVASNDSSNYYSGSWYFDASGDYLTVPYSADSFDFGTGDFTVEAYVNQLARANYTAIISSTNTSINVTNHWTLGYSNTADMLSFKLGSGGSSAVTANFSAHYGKWSHVAATRESGTIRLFFDGQEVASATDTSSLTGDTGNAVKIGQRYTNQNAYSFNGYMSDLRVYKGVAKYTSNFVPAAASPDILPDTPSGVSGGSKLTKITEGAVAFDGTNDSVSIADHADFTFGSGDFTMEAFVYNRGSSYRSIVMKYGGAPSTSSWFWSMYNGQNQFYYYSGGNEPAVTSGQTHYNKWVHCAVSREGNTIRLFDNGELTGTLDVSSYDTMNDSTVPLDIGADYADNYDMDGFISNVRIVKGTALYTKRFTPPSAPLTNVTNTKLLCCQSPTSAGAAVVSPNITGAGTTNSGVVWSDNTTGTIFANRPKENLFDGDTSTSMAPGTSGVAGVTHVTLTIPGGLSNVTSVRVYVDENQANQSPSVTLNSDSAQSISDSAQWVTLTAPSGGTLNTVRFTGNATSTTNNLVEFNAFEVNGVILTDPVKRVGDSAATTFNPFNTDIHTVRGQETGYATLNPLINGAATLSDGNLTSTAPSGNTHGRGRSTLTMDTSGTGKFYFEGTLIVTGGTYPHIGVIDSSDSIAQSDAHQVGKSTNCFSYMTTGNLQLEGGSATSYGDTYTVGDTIGCSLDCGSGELRFYKNGVDQGVAKTITTDYHACFAVSNYGSSGQWKVNFGQKPFKFPPPDGFQPLNAANTRPVKVISRPDQYVGITTWTGDGTNNRVIQAPIDADFAWIKFRDQSYSHSLYDTVRGNNTRLVSNSTGAEGTVSFSFLDNKNIQISGASDTSQNDNNEPFVGWFWKAGGSKNTFNVDDVGYASASDVNMNVGGLNSTLYDQSQRWSDDLVSDNGNYFGTQTPAKAFDGNLTSTKCTSSTGTGGTLTLDLSSNNLTGTLEVVTNTGMSVAVTHSGGTTTIAAATSPDQPETINFGSLTSISQIVVTGVSAPSNAMLYGVKLNGKILVDDNQTPTNVPTIAATGCSVGTKQGFSIIKYTGNSTANATLPHGLSEAPNFVMIKNLDNSYGWAVLHTSAGTTGTTLDGSPEYYMLQLDSSASLQNFSEDTIWNPTSTTVKIDQTGGANWVNNSNSDYIMYAWHDVPGLQKFGEYHGNGSANGTYVELGFRPAVVIVKYAATSGSASWFIYDSERGKLNPNTNTVLANASDVEQTSYAMDFLSNGFKLRYADSAGYTNYSAKYVYMAWAEAPSVDLYGGGANAR